MAANFFLSFSGHTWHVLRCRVGYTSLRFKYRVDWSIRSKVASKQSLRQIICAPFQLAAERTVNINGIVRVNIISFAAAAHEVFERTAPV